MLKRRPLVQLHVREFKLAVDALHARLVEAEAREHTHQALREHAEVLELELARERVRASRSHCLPWQCTPCDPAMAVCRLRQTGSYTPIVV